MGGSYGDIIRRTLECTSFDGLQEILKTALYDPIQDREGAYDKIFTGYKTLWKAKNLDNALGSGSKNLENHPTRLAEYGDALARLMGISAEEKRAVILGAHYHDMGKIIFNVDHINNTKIFDEKEKRKLHPHVIVGAYLVSTGRKEDILVAQVVGYHHENFDGTGYVDHLVAEESPLPARILVVIDRFDTMRTKNHGQKKTVEAALEDLEANSGKQFDPSIVAYFERLIKNNEKIRDIAYRDWKKEFVVEQKKN